MTMKELAKIANVSVATVSKAFNGAEDISQATRGHIFQIAKVHGCYEKFHKGKYHKKTIAVICPEMASSYYTRYVEILRGLIEKANCIPIISADDFDAEKQRELIDYYATYQKVDGIIVFCLHFRLEKKYETPIIAFMSCRDPAVDFVVVNYKQAEEDAVKILTEYGHKHIVFISEPRTRIKGEHYFASMRKYGKGLPCIITSDSRFEKAGEEGVDRLIAEKRQFTALICAYDNIAFGAMKQLKRYGLRVPEDVSVIGMDNISMGQYAETELSSIGTQPEEVCMIAWNLLQKKMNNPFYISKQNITINEELILRKSVARYSPVSSGELEHTNEINHEIKE